MEVGTRFVVCLFAAAVHVGVMQLVRIIRILKGIAQTLKDIERRGK